MSRKVHPIGFRIGSFFSWGDTWYSANYCDMLQQNNIVRNYIKRVLSKYNCIPGDLKISLNFNKVYIYITYYQLEYCPSITSFFLCNQVKKRLANTNLNDILLPWNEIKLVIQNWFQVPVVLNHYKKSNLFDNAQFIAGFIEVKLHSNNSARSLFKYLEKQFFLQRTIFVHSNLCYSTCYKLSGLRLAYSGRIRGARNQMSTKEVIFIGSIPTQSCHKYVDYASKSTYTKYGICGVKVWLFHRAL